MLRGLVLRFLQNRKANVAIIFALIFLLGMALDYTLALRQREQLNAAADAAAIAAVRPAMLTQSDNTIVKATAAAVFATKANLPGLSATPTPTVNVVDSGLARTITVSYTAQSVNNFPNVLGKQTWQISGSATAKASSAPNMNFYLLLDDSPSMGIGATANDISKLITYTASKYQSATSSQNCGFACHETNIAHDGGTKDNLAIARANNINLRIDLVTTAVNQLLNSWSNCPQAGVTGGVMQCMATLNNTTYKAALYTFDVGLNTLATLTTPSTAGTKVSNIALMPVYYQNCVYSGCSSSSATNPTTDYGTDIAGALSSVNGLMPAPGLGSNAAGDTPQEVIFLVTDGVEDKIVTSAAGCPNASLASYKRCQQPLDTAACTTIKNRGIKIAILYTEYVQLIANSATGIQKTDQWYMSWIDKYDQPDPASGTIAKNLQACASPGFYNHVQSSDKIPDALTDLFIKVASSTANLVQ